MTTYKNSFATATEKPETLEEITLRVCAHRMEVEGRNELAREFRLASGIGNLSPVAKAIYAREVSIIKDR